MKILFFLILSSICAINLYSQSALPLRADTVVIEKVGGNSNLKVKSADRDSMGIYYNAGGGLIRNKRSRKITDTSFIIGNDTIRFNKAPSSNFANTDLSFTGNRMHDQLGYYLRIIDNSENMLKLDPANGSYQIGKSNMNGSYLALDTIANRATLQAANAHYFDMDAAAQTSKIVMGGGYQYLFLDANNGIYKIGNLSPFASGNNTYFNVDDAGAQFSFHIGGFRESLLTTNGQWIWDGYPALPAQTDTSLYKPLAIDGSGGVVKMDHWTGIQSISGLTAGRITLSTGSTTIGDDAELTYDATVNKVSTDSLYLFKKLRFNGNLENINATNRGAISFGSAGSDYFRDFDDGLGNTGGYMFKIYPKFACDTCSGNQPFYSTVGTALYDVTQPVNSVVDWLAFGDGSFSKRLIRLAMEQNFYGTWEIHFPEWKPQNSSQRYRCMSMAGNWITGYSQIIYRFDNQITTNTIGTYQYATMSPGAVGFTPYASLYSGTGTARMSIQDSTTNTAMAGFQITGQKSGGINLSTTQHYGEEIHWNFTAAPVFSADAPGNFVNPFNYIFNIKASNTGHPFLISKGNGVFDNIYLWVHNDGRVVVGDAGYFFSNSYKLQAKGGFIAGDYNASNNTVLYTAAFGHGLTSGAGAAGIGSAFTFAADNASNTLTNYGAIEGVATSTVAGSENGDIILKPIRNGSLTEGLRILSTGAVKFNNAFTFPTVDGTSGQALITNGSGTVTWGAPGITSINSQTGSSITLQGGVATYVTNPSANVLAYNLDPTSSVIDRTIDVKITTAQNSSTSETDLYTNTIAGGTLSVDGQTLNFDIDGEVNDNTATAQIKLYFAGNTTLNTGAINILTANTSWRITGRVTRTSSSTAHVNYEMHAPGLATTYFLGYSNLTSLDFTTGNIFKVTAQAGGAGGGTGDITAHSWQILYKPEPQ